MLALQLSLAGLKHEDFVFAAVGAKAIFPPEVLTPTRELSRSSSYSALCCDPFCILLVPCIYRLCHASVHLSFHHVPGHYFAF